jgi:DNA-binding NarL/FixJ family response regulator
MPLTDASSPGAAAPSLSAQAIRVALVEDDPQVREELAAVINGTEGLCCVGAFKDGETALQGMPSAGAEVVLMDINLPGMTGIECVRRLKEARPAQLIVMLTAYQDDDLIFQALAAGAMGYLVKRCSAAELTQAILEVQRGGAPMSSGIARKVLLSFHQPPRPTAAQPKLTGREQELLDYLAKGYCYKEIADLLGTTSAAVDFEIGGIYAKLHLQSRGAALGKFLP